MKQEDHRISLLLGADAEALGLLASLPTALSILWRAKIRAAWKRRQRVAGLVALIEIAGASAVVLVIVGLLWRALLNTPVSSHPLTLGSAGVLTVVAICLCAASLVAARSKLRDG